jgi:hypothetical protein
LIKWLESLQPVKPAAPSPFDALLMPEAVLERGDANDSWHLEMTKADASALAPTIENHEAKRSDSRRSLSGARGAGLRVALAVALTVGVLGVGAYVVRAERHGQAAAATPPPPPTNAAAAPSASTTAVPEPEAVSTPSEPETGRAVIAPRGRLAESAQIPPTNLLGTVAVRGGSHRGASIAIDGKVTPFGAPHYFDLPVGKHVIELRVDGGVTATGMVNVLPEHTPTAPVYWP